MTNQPVTIEQAEQAVRTLYELSQPDVEHKHDHSVAAHNALQIAASYFNERREERKVDNTYPALTDEAETTNVE